VGSGTGRQRLLGIGENRLGFGKAGTAAAHGLERSEKCHGGELNGRDEDQQGWTRRPAC